VFGQALHAGKTAKVYAEGMPGACALESGGQRYAVKHNPWAYFVDERGSCRRYDVPLDRLATDVATGDLPNAGLVVPDLCHDAHDADCDLADADGWLRDEVGAVLAGPDFASGHVAVVITADEDDRSQGNQVLTTVFHPSQHGHVVRTPLTHYSLTGLYDRVLGVRLLRHAATAPGMAEAFGLPLPQR
jgi:phosphatidylinositol-3-phosphatase